MILYLAPLHGLTDWVFRGAYFRHFPGFDAALAPFIATARTDRIRKLHFRDLLPERNRDIRLIPQLLGDDAGGMIQTARVLVGMGYRELNWNLGCPHLRVTRKQHGSGLLPFPDRIDRILDQVCSLTVATWSIKLRLGYEEAGEILRLLPVLNRYPLNGVFLHARVGVQLYRGEVDLDAYAAVAGLCRHELVYNGDILNLERFAALSRRFPQQQSWMIGRPAVRDPFLAGEIRGGPFPADALGRIRSFHDEVYGRYREILSGPVPVLNKMKGIWHFLGDFFRRCGPAAVRLERCHSLEEYEQAVGMILS